MKKIVIALFVAALSNCMSWAAEPGTKSHEEVLKELRRAESRAFDKFSDDPTPANFDALESIVKRYKEQYDNMEYAFRNNTTEEGLRKHRVYRDKQEYYDGMVRGMSFAENILQAPKEGKSEAATLQHAHERLKSDLDKAHHRIKELEAALAEKTGIPMAPAIPAGATPYNG